MHRVYHLCFNGVFPYGARDIVYLETQTPVCFLTHLDGLPSVIQLLVVMGMSPHYNSYRMVLL
jgi:hypothetical protein